YVEPVNRRHSLRAFWSFNEHTRRPWHILDPARGTVTEVLLIPDSHPRRPPRDSPHTFLPPFQRRRFMSIYPTDAQSSAISHPARSSPDPRLHHGSPLDPRLPLDARAESLPSGGLPPAGSAPASTSGPHVLAPADTSGEFLLDLMSLTPGDVNSGF
ncbi:hypothetical protein B296_00011654, partial [Ensete ventricosum]